MHTQIDLLLNMKKACQTAETLPLKLAERVFAFMDSNPGIVLAALPSALMDCCVKFNQPNCTAQKVALDMEQLLEKADISNVLFRAVQPTIFDIPLIENTRLFKMIASATNC